MSGLAEKLDSPVLTGVLGAGGERDDSFGSGREEKISPPKHIYQKMRVLKITNQDHQ